MFISVCNSGESMQQKLVNYNYVAQDRKQKTDAESRNNDTAEDDTGSV